MAGCDCSCWEDVSAHHMMTSPSPNGILKGQVMMSIDVLMKCHKLVTIFDITEHILSSTSAENSLINYSISLKL